MKEKLSKRCGYLNGNGKQCSLDGIKKFNYHGENELYTGRSDENCASWVRVFFCKKHYESTTI